MDMVETNQDDGLSKSEKEYLEVQRKREENKRKGFVICNGLQFAPCEDGSYKLMYLEWNNYGRFKQLECYDIPREINGKPVSAISMLITPTERQVLKKIIIPDSVIDISDYSLESFALSKKLIIQIDANNPAYKVVDGNICTKDGKLLAGIGKSDSGTEIFHVPEGINAIAGAAFPSASYMRDKPYSAIMIPLSVIQIEHYAFPFKGETICYMGTKKDWKKNMSKSTKSIYNKAVYFYSEKPVKNSWHYADDGVTPVITKK